jgi:hypothetical protein
MCGEFHSPAEHQYTRVTNKETTPDIKEEMCLVEFILKK